MSTGSQREVNLTTGPKELRFRHWPLRQEPWRSLVLLIVAACAAVLVARAVNNVWAGIAAWLALALCLWRMWLPVDFEFGPRGILQVSLGRRQRVAWRDIARCEFQKRGLLLHATDDRSALGAMRSIYVRYPPQRDQLREIVEFEMARWSARTMSSSIETIRRKGPLDGDGASNSE